jgi:peptide/nickel transport system substrate-binding protein
VSEDGLTYTFTIDANANWSDGTPITANDVLFTYNAITNDAVESPRKADLELIADLTVVDDKTFTVTLSQPNCTVWGSAFTALRPIPAHMYSEDFSEFMANSFNTQPTVTSGPYVWAETAPDEFVRLTANENYYRGAPQIQTVINRIITDPAIQNQALQTGEIDYAFMYPDQLEQLGDQETFNVFIFPLNNTPMLIMNWADAENPQPAYDEEGNLIEQTPNRFFSDVRVRQAIAMGYDKAAIMETLGPDGGYLLSGPITPSFGWVGADVEPYPYDPEAAAALLDEAGWLMNDATGVREKDGVPFEVTLSYAPLVDLYTNIALVAQDQLGQLGIRINIDSQEWSSYLTNVLLPQNYDLTIVGFGGGVEVDGIAYNTLLSENDIPGAGFNIASYINPEMDELLRQGRSLVGCSQEERAEFYRQIQQIAHDDVAYEYTVGTNQVHVMNDRITNYNPGPWNSYVNIEGWGVGD